MILWQNTEVIRYWKMGTERKCWMTLRILLLTLWQWDWRIISKDEFGVGKVMLHVSLRSSVCSISVYSLFKQYVSSYTCLHTDSSWKQYYIIDSRNYVISKFILSGPWYQWSSENMIHWLAVHIFQSLFLFGSLDVPRICKHLIGSQLLFVSQTSWWHFAMGTLTSIQIAFKFLSNYVIHASCFV